MTPMMASLTESDPRENRSPRKLRAGRLLVGVMVFDIVQIARQLCL